MSANILAFLLCLLPGIAMEVYLIARMRQRRAALRATRPIPLRPMQPEARRGRPAPHRGSSPGGDTYVASSSYSSSDAASCSDGGGGCGGD